MGSEGNAARVNVREVAVPGGVERIPGPARDVMDSALGSARRDAAAGLANGLQGDRSERLCSREDCGKPLTGRQSKWCSDACYWRVWDRANPRMKGRARQAALPGESRVERAFAAWIATPAGRHVEREVIRLARDLRAVGITRYGIAGIWERLRWDRAVRVPGSAEWKLDNRYRSHLARKVMAEVPELAGLFETRDLRGRA